MPRKRVKVSGGFLLLLAVLFYLDEGADLLLPGLAACLLHEMGHIFVIRMLGGRIERLELTAAGAVLVLDARFPLSYRREAVSAMAGPMVNFLVGGVAVCFGGYLTAGLNLAAGMFNLLPIWPMDGGRALRALLSNCWDAEKAERSVAVVSGTLICTLFAVGFMLLERLGNPTLFITSGILLICGLKKRFLK